MCSCTRLHDAQVTVAECDSLYAIGQTCTDSTRMLAAYKHLRPFKHLKPNEWAKINYYLGRHYISQQKEYKAVSHLISTIDSNTECYETIARSYNNLATICRQQHQDSLSLIFYNQATDFFKKSNNTKSYYYALNNLEWTKSKLQNDTKSIKILDSLAHITTDADIINKLYETKLFIFNNVHQYDSALIIIDNWKKYESFKMSNYGNFLQAQTYQDLAETDTLDIQQRLQYGDSARIYAQKIIQNSNDAYSLIGAYYVMIQDTIGLSQAEISAYASLRADLFKEVDNTTARQNQAIVLLQQFIKKNNNKRKLYLLYFGIILIIVITLPILIHKYKTIARKEHESNIKIERHQQIVKTQLLQTIDSIRQCPDFEKEFMWKDYKQMTHLVNFKLFNIISKISSEYPSLDEKDIRICILVILGFKYDEIANLIHRSPSSISRFKRDIAKKMGTKSELLQDFLIGKIIY